MQATTPVDFRVADAMLPLLTSKFGNPHSNSHYLGWVLLFKKIFLIYNQNKYK